MVLFKLDGGLIQFIGCLYSFILKREVFIFLFLNNCVSLIDIFFYFDILRGVFCKENAIKVESLVFNWALFCDVCFYRYLPATLIWRRVFHNESAVIKWRHYILFLDVESILLSCVFCDLFFYKYLRLILYTKESVS